MALIGRRDPSGAAVEGRVLSPMGVWAIMVRCPGALAKTSTGTFKNPCRTPRKCPSDKAGELGQPRGPAERLDILVQNLIGGRSASGLAENFNFVGIFRRRSAVLLSQARNDFGGLPPRWQE